MKPMNQLEWDLIEDPPPKNPYFTRPDVANFITLAEQESSTNRVSRYNSLIQLFGLVEKMSDEQQTQFILQILKHGLFTPDFDAAADAMNVANGHHVHRRFNSILAQQGFDFNTKTGQLTGNGNLPKDAKPARETPKEEDISTIEKKAGRKKRKHVKVSKGKTDTSGEAVGRAKKKKKPDLGLSHKTSALVAYSDDDDAEDAAFNVNIHD